MGVERSMLIGIGRAVLWPFWEYRMIVSEKHLVLDKIRGLVPHEPVEGKRRGTQRYPVYLNGQTFCQNHRLQPRFPDWNPVVLAG